MSETRTPALAEAEARSRQARKRLFDTLGEVQERLNPVILAQDAVGTVAATVARDAAAAVRARPRAIAAAAGLVVLFMARRPIARLIGRGVGHATTVTAASLTQRRGKNAPKKGSST